MFQNNRIIKTKYTLRNFFSKKFASSIQKISNIYILVITVLTFKKFSPNKLTFTFILIYAMIKEQSRILADINNMK